MAVLTILGYKEPRLSEKIRTESATFIVARVLRIPEFIIDQGIFPAKYEQEKATKNLNAVRGLM